MTTITVKTRIITDYAQKLPREKLFSMEVNLKTNTARVRYAGNWYPVAFYRLPNAASGVYEAMLEKPLPGHIYATEYAFLGGAPWKDFMDMNGKQMLVQHRNSNRISSSIIFWVKENGQRKRRRVYGRVLTLQDGNKVFVPRVKEAV